VPSSPPHPRSLPLFSGATSAQRAPAALADAGPAPPGYAVLFMDGATERQGRSGLSHTDAMEDAEELQREGKTARVMHVVGARSYEVDRYPPR
jgi:hypothetical protein